MLSRFQAIGAGHAHSLAATATGLVLSWGFGGSGALGHGTDENTNEPKLVEALVDDNQAVLGVACGEYHSAAVTRDGHLWMWGDGAGGQLGVEGRGGGDQNVLVPMCLNPSQGIHCEINVWPINALPHYRVAHALAR